MKPLTSLLSCVCFLACAVLPASCLSTEVKRNSSSDISLTGSTPGDEQMKSMLTIKPDTKIDFIRWDLVLKPGASAANTFSLNINFGIGQPNTNGFIGGGEKRSFSGKYTVARVQNDVSGEVYRLKDDASPMTVSMVKLNDNVFHLLTADNNLILGNDGWSYILNRKDPLPAASGTLPVPTSSTVLLSDTPLEVTFAGRTPCMELARQYDLNVTSDCTKLKWRLILNRDPKTLQPATYQLYWTQRRPDAVEGKWKIIKGTPSNPEAVIYQLDPDKPDESFYLLALDKNTLYFISKDHQLLTGDSDFSFALNRRME